MAVNFTLLTSAAPYIIDAANSIISYINKNKQDKKLQDKLMGHDEKLDLFEDRLKVLLKISEDQSKVIRDLAEQNQKLILALKNTRLAAILGVVLSLLALGFTIFMK